MQKLFYTRLTLYLLAFLIPVIHPAVAVPFDRVMKWICFALIPGEMFIAFYMRPPRVALKWGLLAGVLMIASTVLFITGLNRGAFIAVGAGLLSYVWTFLVFFGNGRLRALPAIEAFLIGYLYYKILTFARASEEIANRSALLTTFLIGFSVVAFLVHVIVLYFTAYRDRSGRGKTETVVFAGIAVVATLTAGFLLPKDFVQNDIVFNELDPEPERRSLDGDLEEGRRGQGQEGQGRRGQGKDTTQNGKPLGNRNEKFPSELQGNRGGRGGQPQPDNGEGGGRGGQGQNPEGEGGGRGQGNPEGEGGGQGQGGGGQPQEGQGGGQGQDQGQNRQHDNKLEGVPADQWEQFKNQGGGEGKQMAVMIIGSETQPIYAAERYLGKFDSSDGFLLSENQVLNTLRSRRLLETWKDPEPSVDPKRMPFDIFYLSTIPDRVVAYRPFSIQPTVMDKQYHPFDLSYTASSAISLSSPAEWENVPDPGPGGPPGMEDYLKYELPNATERKLQAHLDKALKGRAGYFDRIEGILLGFQRFQYKMGFTEDTSVETIEKFISQSRTGDCTEFAYSAAILGRMAKIPARVVVGYLASKDLQTPAHRGGIVHLQKKIPKLRDFKRENLYLVTNAHRHAWVQFYIPKYGWIDFETTSYAIPPERKFDPNAKDVVIPLIEEEELKEPKDFRFPWKLALQIAGILAGTLIVTAYSFRFLRLMFYGLRSKGKSRKALDAMSAYLFIRFAENGHDIRKRSETPLEYAEKILKTNRNTGKFGNRPEGALPALIQYAEMYTLLRFKEFFAEGEKEQAWTELKKSHKEAIRQSKKPGFLAVLRRIFTLRGFQY